MRAINTIKSAAGLVAVAVLLAACSTPIKPPEQAHRVAKEKDPFIEQMPGPDTPPKAPIRDELDNPNSPLAKRSVYFDFDQYVVKTEYSGTVNAHSKYLSSNKGKKILIQGNTDERGGREYNLALGQKRAEAVRKSMALLGVPDAQMEAVSMGKEKPKATGSDEASWAENRRADIIYSGK
ncbi:peptidoglycan-associated lipoprotein Pal [Undibacterium sp. Di27W]|uniref:peptidoglycan-associated lipoprotein Pal n=1 Tax=Undibacterium sp. Di27W TaxID=3413036 RepID=UPI003BF2D63E